MSLITTNSMLRDMAKDYNIWVILIPLTSTSAFIWDGIYVGVTASKEMRNAMIISSIFIFLPVYYLTSGYIGNNALWLALNVFMVSRALLMWAMWNRIKNRSFMNT